MTAPKSPQIVKKSSSTRRVRWLAIAGLLILIAAVGSVVALNKLGGQEAANRLSTEKPAQIMKSNETNSAEDVADEGSNTPTVPVAISADQGPTPIQFADTTEWNLELTPKNKSYKVIVSPMATYGYCEGDESVLMFGMIFMNPEGAYDCSGILSALTATNPQLTRIAFGLEKNIAIPSDAEASNVNLMNGAAAKRYTYVTTEDNQKYNNIKYIATVGEKSYVAHMRWPEGYDMYAGSDAFYSPSVFDTIAQKTWYFF